MKACEVHLVSADTIALLFPLDQFCRDLAQKLATEGCTAEIGVEVCNRKHYPVAVLRLVGEKISLMLK